MRIMRVRIHRGAREIGGSCVQIEADGATLLVDAGLPLADRTPALPKSLSTEVGLSAILISHPHLDHYGLLAHMPQVPVVMGAAARRIIQAARPYIGLPALNLAGVDLVDRKPIAVGPFRVTPYLVDHSAYDAYALLIEAAGRRLFYSGDLRTHGRMHRRVERLIAMPPADIDALLLEGTTLGRKLGNPKLKTEVEIEEDFTTVFRDTSGIALVQVSPQNIDRLVSIYRACLRSGRTLLIDLYAAEVLAATMNLNIPQSHWRNIGLCIPQRQRIQIKRNRWFDSLARHSCHRVSLKKHVSRNPGGYALLFRGLWMRDLEQADCLAGASLIHSQWEGYLQSENSVAIGAWRKALGLPFRQIHTSGHASPTDLRRIADAIAPRVLVPIHTDDPAGYESLGGNVVCHPDGIWWDV